jgi:hypothetical protein
MTQGHAGQPAGWEHVPAVLPGAVLAGTGLVAAATVAGAWLARRRPGQRRIWFAAAAGALLIIAGLHLLPDAPCTGSAERGPTGGAAGRRRPVPDMRAGRPAARPENW